MGINQKILDVLKSIEGQGVEKNGLNTFSNYKYVTEIDVIRFLSPHLTANNLTHRISFISYDAGMLQKDKSFYSWGKCQAELTLTDVESNESITTYAAGYSEDKNGDKALYKAMTGASKYAYLKAFGLGSGEDPENEDKDQKPTNNKPAAPTHKPTVVKDDLAIDAKKVLLDEILALVNKNRMGPTDVFKVVGSDINSIKSNEAALEQALNKLRVATALGAKTV